MGVFMANSSPLTAGSTLEKRYRIVRELGYGGFGRTYLAEDLNRYNEYCVLKEFAPQVQSSYEVQKAEELFKREAGVLYKLQHPQIPRFRELLRLNVGGREALFLAQDYVDGETYADVLISRQQRGQRFSEAEVTQLLLQILPVLQYIHSLGVVHRDISPENLIQRRSDNLPVLIDFGAVKQAATTVISQSTGRQIMTLLGKEGFAPQEQIQQGQAFPCTDLYTLAVTILVLLTGKDPKALYDTSKMAWRWRQEVSVNPTLGNVLDKMLAHRPRDRYQSAKEVLQILESANLNLSPSPVAHPAPTPAVHSQLWSAATHTISRMQTVNFINRHHRRKTNVVSPNPGAVNGVSPLDPDLWANLQAALFSMVLVVLVGMGAWGLVTAWNFVTAGISGVTRWQPPKISIPVSLPPISLPTQSDNPLDEAEIAQHEEIVKRSQSLGISEGALYSKVDGLFYRKYPELKGRSLTSKPQDAKYRQRWRDIASDYLDRVEKGEGI